MFPIKATVTIGTHAELERFTAFIAANTDANVKSAPKLGNDNSAGAKKTGESASAGSQQATASAGEVPGKPKTDPAQTAPSKPTAGKTDAPAASTTKQEPQADTAKVVDVNSAPARADVSKAAVALALKDKAQIVAILAKFDAKGVKDVPDDKLAEVFPLINAALEALGG